MSVTSLRKTRYCYCFPSVHPAALWRRLTNLVLSADPARRTLVAMALLGLILMVSSTGVILFLEHRGVIASGGLAPWWGGVSVGGLVVITWLIRSGWSARRRDPSLTLWQMAWTITSGAVAYVFAGEARGVVPSVLAMILFFGALGLNLVQVITIGLYAMAAFAVAVLASAHMSNGSFTPMDIAYALMIMIVLSGCMALNLRIQRIRFRLRVKSRELTRALAENRELALRDELTGLLNRRAMTELVGLEQRVGLRTRRAWVLAMLDLDHFKPINDTHGHATGDRALQVFASTASSIMREGDVLARWGGDEFLLMLSDTTPEQGVALIERLCAAVSALEVPNLDGPLGLTLSAGLTLSVPGEPVERTIHRADEALYRAKAQGRNRVVVADAEKADPVNGASTAALSSSV